MLCEDCLFETGADEYPMSVTYKIRCGGFRCKRCDEIVGIRKYRYNYVENGLIETISEKENTFNLNK